MKSVLIAGGAGFIGSHLADRFLKENYRVVVVDNLITGFFSNIEHLKNNSYFTFLNDNISKIDWEIDLNFNLILHFASPASPPKYFSNPRETIKANTNGTENLLNLAKKNNAKLIFASTSEIYGDPLVSPQTETYWGNVNPIGPRSVYDESKRLGETLCFQGIREGLDVGVVRIFNTYGPRMDPYDGRVVSSFIRQGLNSEPLTVQGSGNQTRSFCYINDLVDAIFAFSQIDNHGPINIGNDREVSVLELAQIVIKILKIGNTFAYLPPLEDDPKQRKPDLTLAKQLLNWSPKTSLEEGIMKTVEWMKLQKI